MKSDLLDAVLEDVEFRAKSLQRARQLARQRRMSRIVRHSAMAALFCAAMVWLAVYRSPQPMEILPSLDVVRSESGHFTEVHSAPRLSVNLAASDIRIFSTWDLNPNIKFLDDQELVATLREHRALLINQNSKGAKVIFY